MKTFSRLRTTKKGKVGEKIIKGILKERGLFVYVPESGSHPFDFMCSLNGAHFFAVEVKTYPRLHSRPQTGIDRKDWIGYTGALEKTGVDCVLFFVDQFEELIYYRKISDLIQYAQVQRKKVYFPLGAFKIERKLTQSELIDIRSNNSIPMLKYRSCKRFFVPGWQKVQSQGRY